MTTQNTTNPVENLVVHPKHGVGKIQSLEQHTVDGTTFKVVVVFFARDKLTLRLPLARVDNCGVRPIASEHDIKKALKTLKKPVENARKGIWARRAQELQVKLGSGRIEDLVDVINELGYGGDIGSQSYSERRFFYTAVERFIEEWGYVSKISPEKAQEKIATLLRSQTVY
jgi:CarD family transcriptional regulator